MTNPEFETGFDILYNNITSNQAPGLNQTEMSFFLNKAQLELLKNHFNFKGNKYEEGFDGSAKRHLEFSSLIEEKTINMAHKEGTLFTVDTFGLPYEYETTEGGEDINVPTLIDRNTVFSYINETILCLSGADIKYLEELAYLILYANMYGTIYYDVNGDGRVNILDVTSFISRVLLPLQNISNMHFDEVPNKVKDIITLLLTNSNPNDYVHKVLLSLGEGTPSEIYESNKDTPLFEGIKKRVLSVVPISHLEYDRLISRPFCFPNKRQCWKVVCKDKWDLVLPPDVYPIEYRVRYVRLPRAIDLSDSTKTCELPEVVHQEILQRAVELAKLSWEGSINSAVAAGQNSE